MKVSSVGPPAGALAIVALVCFSGAVGIAAVRDRTAPREVIREAVLYVPSPAVLGRLALSYDALLADVYWIRALQHFGGTRLAAEGPKKYELLYPLLDITTALDPKFNIAYRFGAIFLSEPPPGGPGRPDLAIKLLQRGLEARPTNWRYMQDIGFVHYWALGDYVTAAEWFERGAQQPGAPWWMRSMAATLLAGGGDRASSRRLWQMLLESAGDNEWLQRDAARRLQQLDALDAIDTLQAIVDDWLATGPARPYSWQALIRAGRLRAVPRDPAGVPFELGPYSGRVDVADESPLRPLPTELVARRPK